jgi:hypothetical protein
VQIEGVRKICEEKGKLSEATKFDFVRDFSFCGRNLFSFIATPFSDNASLLHGYNSVFEL